MRYKASILALTFGMGLLHTGCMEDFAEINTNPSDVNKANIAYLFTQEIYKFEPSDYTFWFYNAKYMHQFVQAFVPTSGFTASFNLMGENAGQGQQYLHCLRYSREIDNLIAEMPEEEGAQYRHVQAMANMLPIYLGLFDTDMYGDIPYTEACKGLYTDPMLLTPKFEKVSELYDKWLAILEEDIRVLSAPVEVNGKTIIQTPLGTQDFIYKGDAAKWARFANTLRLKIAVRLLTADRARAISLAEEIARHPAGLVLSDDGDLIFCKGIQGDNEQVTHWGEAVSSGAGSMDVVKFLVKNKDPRVRFFYEKNDYNSKVVQAFFDYGKDLPAYIAENVNYEVVDGKKVFKSWKGDGEPWVRYYGLPTDLGAASEASKYGDYFVETRWKIGPADAEKTFYPYASFASEMISGRIDFTLPTAPGGPVIEDKDDMPWYGMYLTGAEINLYLAEFKLLGANLPETAQGYFNEAVTQSVKAYDKLSALNKVPYYGTTYNYDPFEVAIDLRPGEIEALLARPDYQLTGSKAEQLEKVYIQQYLHFMFQPDDQFVTVRRSGVPKVGSSLIPWKNIVPNTQLPRRMEILLPAPTDLMYESKLQSAKDQGFTAGKGLDPSLLNKERVWQDIGAPNFGEGPNL